jgi:predicted polyphosphate/ATP-dependent NAD kinase
LDQKKIEIARIGLIVNPISGMGGSVGLKGTDGQQVLQVARKMGAIPNATERARLFLTELFDLKERLLFICPPNCMGEDIVKEMGFNSNIIDQKLFSHKISLYDTNSQDTITAAKEIVNLKADILIFIGGDGTARDVYTSIGQSISVLGVPAGVKIHSSVFCINPEKAAQLLKEFLYGIAPIREAEVLDIDEDEFRNNRVVSKLYGYMKTPYSPQYSQASKMGSPQTEDEKANQESIAQWVIDEMKTDDYYILGPGTTTKAICDVLKEKKTLLGVDLMQNKKVIAYDLNEEKLLKFISKSQNFKFKLIVTPIGQQGFVFGRGNLQLSAKVLQKLNLEDIIIICSKYKLGTLQNSGLKIDTRDTILDEKMRGFYRILVDYGEYRIVAME